MLNVNFKINKIFKLTSKTSKIPPLSLQKLINFPLSSNKPRHVLDILINRGNKSVNESPRNSTKPETTINPQLEQAEL